MLQDGFEEFKLSGGMPSPPGVGMAVLRATQGEDADLELLIRCLEVDPASALRVLRSANVRGAAQGLNPCSVFAAAVVLGPRELRTTALGFTLPASSRSGLCEDFDYENFWSWSLACALTARKLAEVSQECDPAEAHVSGLLAHSGELALACAHPQAYGRIRREHQAQGIEAMLEAERSAFEIHRWAVSAALMGECGLPARFGAATLALAPAQTQPTDEDEATTKLAHLTEAGTLGAEWLAGARLSSRPREELWKGLVGLAAGLSLSESQLQSVMLAVQQEWERLRGLTRIGSQEDGPASTDPAAGTTQVQPIKVLVVDDDGKLRRLVGHLLRSAGYQVLEARDGEEGLAQALQETPQIIVTDWTMPGMSGLELCRTLRRMESGRRTFVLVLTAKEDEERALEAFNAGADDYVTKPFNPRILLARVQAGRRLIELQQQVESDKVDRLKQVAEMGLMTRKLRTAALTDFLTELPNRRYATSRLEQEWAAAERLGRPLSVVLIDIDHFKRINDEHGHDIGDLVLQATAQALRSRTRRGDVVCRLGGEEFLVLNVNSDLAGAWKCAERLRLSVETNLIRTGGFEGRVTVSLGVACRQPGMKGPQSLLKAADAAVYEAKAAGRNTIRGERPPETELRESA